MSEKSPGAAPLPPKTEWNYDLWNQEGPEAMAWAEKAKAYEDEREERERAPSQARIVSEKEEDEKLCIPLDEETEAQQELIQHEMDRLDHDVLFNGFKWLATEHFGISRTDGKVLVKIKRMPETPGELESGDFNYVPKSPDQTFEETVGMFEEKAELYRAKHGANRGYFSGSIKAYPGIHPHNRQGKPVMMCQTTVVAEFTPRWAPASELKPFPRY